MIQKFKFKKEVNLSDSINLIPMINLVFLLLIFFTDRCYSKERRPKHFNPRIRSRYEEG